MTEPTELLPCPFCGGAPTTIERPDNIDGTQFFYAIACYCGRHSACAHKMAVRKTPEIAKADAIAAWNTRTTQPTQAQAGAVPEHQPTPDVQAKMDANQWDHFGDILPTLKAISRGEWYWGANSRCKYIEIRLDTRDGGCILYDRERVRISPEQFAHQSHPIRMEPWPGIKGGQHG